MGDLVGSKALTTQSDPALVLQQALANREKQYAGITNPQQQLAARLGGLLGGGLVNVAQDRNFFDINDPLLNRVTQIQGIYNDVASRIDPSADPTKFYTELQSAYSNAGLGREALAASEEARKSKVAGMDVQLKEAQLYEKDPTLLVNRIEQASKLGTPEGDAEAYRLSMVNQRLTENRDLELKAKRVAILKDEAYIKHQNDLAEQGRYNVVPVDKDRPELGWMRFDLKSKNPSESAEHIKIPESMRAQFESKKPTTATSGERKPLGSFDTTTQMPPTDNVPRARGKMEQAELDTLAEKKRVAAEADRPRQEALQQSREQINSINQLAAQRGLIPMGQASYFDPELTFLDPKTQKVYRASEL